MIYDFYFLIFDGGSQTTGSDAFPITKILAN